MFEDRVLSVERQSGDNLLPTYRVRTHDGHRFLKAADPIDITIEREARRLARLCSLQAHVIPAWEVTFGGRPHLCMPWIEATRIDRARHGAQRVRTLPEGRWLRLLLFEWLLGDYDRHGGNCGDMSGLLILFDFGFGLSARLAWNRWKSALGDRRPPDRSAIPAALLAAMQAAGIAWRADLPDLRNRAHLDRRLQVLSTALDRSDRYPFRLLPFAEFAALADDAHARAAGEIGAQAPDGRLITAA